MKKTEYALVHWGSKAPVVAVGAWVAAFAGVLAGTWQLRWFWVVYGVATLVVLALLSRWTTAVREHYIREAPLPRFLQRAGDGVARQKCKSQCADNAQKCTGDHQVSHDPQQRTGQDIEGVDQVGFILTVRKAGGRAQEKEALSGDFHLAQRVFGGAFGQRDSGLHGGRLLLESEPDHGCRFTLQLQRQPDTAQP